MYTLQHKNEKRVSDNWLEGMSFLSLRSFPLSLSRFFPVDEAIQKRGNVKDKEAGRQRKGMGDSFLASRLHSPLTAVFIHLFLSPSLFSLCCGS